MKKTFRIVSVLEGVSYLLLLFIATPIKYLMKSFPIASQASGYLPMFYPSLAKDLGIKMQSQYGIR